MDLSNFESMRESSIRAVAASMGMSNDARKKPSEGRRSLLFLSSTLRYSVPKGRSCSTSRVMALCNDLLSAFSKDRCFLISLNARFGKTKKRSQRRPS